MQYYLVVMNHADVSLTQYKLPIGWEDMDDISSVDEYAERYMHIDLSNCNWMLSDKVIFMNTAFLITPQDFINNSVR
jgi:hypothetical protein